MNRKNETRFAGHTFAGGGLYDDHPLLANFASEWAELHLASFSSEPHAVLSALRKAVSNLCECWRTFDGYANDQQSAHTILRQGYGMLLRAPAPVIQAAAIILDEFSVKNGWLSTKRKDTPARVLFLGHSYLIAEEIRIEKLV